MRRTAAIVQLNEEQFRNDARPLYALTVGEYRAIKVDEEVARILKSLPSVTHQYAGKALGKTARTIDRMVKNGTIKANADGSIPFTEVIRLRKNNA